MKFDGAGLHRFVVDSEGGRLINSKEKELSYQSSKKGYDVPYWVEPRLLAAMAISKYDIIPDIRYQSRDDLVNFGEIGNYRELVDAGMLPAPPDLSQEQRSRAWTVDGSLFEELYQHAKISVEECGSCCVPFAHTGAVAKDANAYSAIYMPPMDVFKSKDAYCHTLFHEMTHVQLVKDRALQSAELARKELESNPEEASWVRHKNEIAAELGANLLAHVFIFNKLPQEPDKYSVAYMHSHGVGVLAPDEHHEIVLATSKAVYHTIEAVPQIAHYSYEHAGAGKSDSPRPSARQIIDVDYEELNRLPSSDFASMRRSYLEYSLDQVKCQLKRHIEAQQAKQIKPNEKPAGEKLQQPAPKHEHHPAPSRTAQPNASKGQTAKTKAQPEASKSRDFER